MSLTNSILPVLIIASLPKTSLDASLKHRYPSVRARSSTPICFVRTNQRRTFDLSRLCGSQSSPSQGQNNPGSSSANTPSQPTSQTSVKK
ncbi:MAG: hypothetical protein KME64_20715 [Scytonematopsis contorta HA4267-MV1]|jgi:hypothetical protein|nr:hypothetical protein [Scytonematopsis contorta HA4267-MV1]